MAISTNGAIITRLAGALYGEYLSNASYTEVSTTAPATVAANWLTNDFASKTDLQVATTILTNLGLTSITGLDNWLSAQLTAAGSTAAAKGAALVSILNGYAGMTADATYGTYAVGFNAKVDAALTLSQTTGAKGGAFATADVVAATNGTFTLTTGLDTGSKFSGAAGDDTFVSISSSDATVATLTSGDSLVGGAGVDTLTVAVSGTITTAPSVSTSGIENLSIVNNSTGAAYTTDATLMAGLAKVVVNAGANPTTVNNSGIVNLEVVGSNKAVTIAPVATALTGTADSATITLNSVATTADTTITYNGVETLNVVSNGGATGSSTGAGTRLTLSDNALDKITVSGSAATRLQATFSGATGSTEAGTLDASASTGGVNAVVTAGGSTLLALTGGTGNDSFTVGAVTKNMTVDGGAGTDTISVSSAAYIATATTHPGANVKNVEVLEIAAAGSADVRAFPATTFTSISTLGTGTVAGLSAAAATINASATGTITATRATDGTADAITVNLAATTPGSYAVSVANDETVSIVSGGTDVGTNTISTLTGTSLKSLTVTGTNALTVTTLTGGESLATIDASGNTGSTFTIDATNSGVAITATGSAGLQSSDGALVNKITTGSGADKITGGAYYDSLTGGIGHDTIDGGAGNDKLYGDSGNDSILGGTGNDLVVGDVGNDVLDGGEGDDTVSAGTGSDTVTGAAGNDRIYVTTLTDDDNIDGGVGTDILSASAITSTGALVAEYADVTDAVAPTIAGVETAYVQVTTTGTNTSAVLAQVVDLTKVTGLTTLWLDVEDGNTGTTDNDEYIVVKNFGGSTINLSETHNSESLTLDGTGQASLTLNLRNYANVANTEATVFTGVESVVISGTSVTGSANTKLTNTLGAVTAATASGLSLQTSGSLVTDPNTGALTVHSATANNASTVKLSAAAHDTLTVTTDVIASNGLVETLTIAGAAGSTTNVDGADLTLTGSNIRTATIDLAADANFFDATVAGTVNLAATRVATLTGTIGANADLSLDLDANITSGTVAMSSGSTWNAETIGGSGASSITVTGTGNFYATAAVGSTKLSGTTATFNAGGLVDADGISVHSTATTGATIVGATGANEISGGAGADDFTGGASADRFGITGHTETITLTYTAADVITFTANGVSTGNITVAATTGTAATDLANEVTQVINAINANTATHFAVASSTAAGVVTVTYNQYFGVLGASGGANAARAVVAAGAAGDNAGSDTISGGVGADTIIGGTGADVMSGGLGNDAFLQISATDTGFVAAAAAISTVALDKITANAGDTVKLFLQTAGGYDAFTTLVTTGNVQNTVTANTGTNGTVGRTQGVYDATANTFTVGATGANAVLVSYSTTNAGTTADQQIVIVGVTDLTSVTDGVITV